MTVADSAAPVFVSRRRSGSSRSARPRSDVSTWNRVGHAGQHGDALALEQLDDAAGEREAGLEDSVAPTRIDISSW